MNECNEGDWGSSSEMTQAYYKGQSVLTESSGYLSTIQRQKLRSKGAEYDEESMGGCMEHSNGKCDRAHHLAAAVFFPECEVAILGAASSSEVSSSS